jgi:hypothetical protein
MRRIALLLLVAGCPKQPPAAPRAPTYLAGDEVIFFRDSPRAIIVRADGCVATEELARRTDYEPCLAPAEVASLFREIEREKLVDRAPCFQHTVAYRHGTRLRYVPRCESNYLNGGWQNALAESDYAVEHASSLVVKTQRPDGIPSLTVRLADDGTFTCERLVDVSGTSHAHYRVAVGEVSPETAQFAIADVAHVGGPNAPGAMAAITAALGGPSPLCEPR